MFFNGVRARFLRKALDRGGRDKFGLESQIGRFTREKMLESFCRTIWHQEGPMGGLPNCALEEVAFAARARGVPVLQDGTGLDEAFGGYRNHHNLYLGMLLRDGQRGAEEAIGEYAANWGVDRETARRAALGELAQQGSAIDGTIPVRRDLLLDHVDSDTRDVDRMNAGLPRWTRHGDELRSEMIRYLQVSKIPRNLRMKDRGSMAFGIELRVPFLDHRLVEYALSLPAEYYFKNGWSKAILRDAMAGSMPDSVRLAPKRSIQAPQGPWLRSESLMRYVTEILESEAFADLKFVDTAKAKSAYEDFCKRGAENSFFVWQWINLRKWFRIFIEQDPLDIPYPACREISGIAA